MSTPKKAEVLERMKNGETLRHYIGFVSEVWKLGENHETINGNTGKAVIKSASVECVKDGARETIYAWKSEAIPAQEALEAQRAQAAGDLAGKEAYNEVKAEAAEPEGYMRPCEHCGGTGVEYHHAIYPGSNICPECDGTGIHQEDEDETAQLRAENEALKAENLRLEAENESLKISVAELEAVVLNGAILKQAPTQAEASEVTLDKPKFIVVPASSNSYHVVQVGRNNAFGERFCVDSWLSHQDAQGLCDKLNRGIVTLEELGLET